MTTLKSLLNDYLSKEEMLSLIESYDDYKKYDKNALFLLFYNIMIKEIFPLINVESKVPTTCGSGSVGCVVSIESEKFDFDKFEKQTKIPLYRIRKSKLTTPKKIALKIQILDSKDKYWEARILREEFIQNKLSEYKTINEYIPNFYFGCTVNMPYKNDIVRFRLTFMDLIDVDTYRSLLSVLKLTGSISDKLYKKIESLAHTLWKHGISHNDLSVNNILVDEHNNIKLLDFGLSSTITRKLNESNLVVDYNDYFATLDKSEQNGSNVAKLNELFQYVKT